MKTILIDIDGVVADLHRAWLDLYNAEYHDSLTHTDIVKWEMHEIVKPECGMKIYDFLHHPDIYRKTPPISGAVDGVRKLKNAGHIIVFVTAGLSSEKERWMEFLGFGSKKDIISADATKKHMIEGDVMIEDYQPTLSAWYRIGRQGILINRPWNQHTPWSPRVAGWPEIVKMLEEK